MTVTSDKTLFQSVIKMIDALAASGNYNTIIHILSLLCLFSVLNQTPLQQQPSLPAADENAVSDNPLQKLLGSLMKTDGGSAAPGASPLSGALGAALGSPDLLGSLLPLLGNPQIKSKINPANIASVMGMINNLGGLGGLANLGGGLAAAAQAATEKNEAKPKAEKKTPEEAPAPSKQQPDENAAEKNETTPERPIAEKPPLPAGDRRPANRFLNWKTNF